MSENRIEDIKARRAAITPGKWGLTRYVGGMDFSGPLNIYCGTDPDYGEPRKIPATDDDKRFIAAAPADIDYLLAELARLQAECARLDEENNKLRDALHQQQQDEIAHRAEDAWYKNPDDLPF